MAGANTKQQKAQQKALEKQKQKIVEDKTFGLKNKKSKSVQKYIKSVQQQITGQPPKDSDKYLAQQNKEKEEKNRIMQQKALIASLFKTTETVKQVSMESQKAYEPKQSRMDQKIDIYLDQRIQRSKEGWRPPTRRRKHERLGHHHARGRGPAEKHKRVHHRHHLQVLPAGGRKQGGRRSRAEVRLVLGLPQRGRRL